MHACMNTDDKLSKMEVEDENEAEQNIQSNNLSLFSAFVFSSSVFIFNKNDNLHTYAILCHMS